MADLTAADTRLVLDLELDDPRRTVASVPAEGIGWALSTGSADMVAAWIGNATDADRHAIRLAAKVLAAEGRALHVSFPSVAPFYLGYDFTTRRWTSLVPQD